MCVHYRKRFNSVQTVYLWRDPYELIFGDDIGVVEEIADRSIPHTLNTQSVMLATNLVVVDEIADRSIYHIHLLPKVLCWPQIS